MYKFNVGDVVECIESYDTYFIEGHLFVVTAVYAAPEGRQILAMEGVNGEPLYAYSTGLKLVHSELANLVLG